MTYVEYLRAILADPERYPYSDKDANRLKSIISSQMKRIREFERRMNSTQEVQKHTKKRNMKLEGLIDVLDEKLGDDLKIRLMKRMRAEI